MSLSEPNILPLIFREELLTISLLSHQSTPLQTTNRDQALHHPNSLKPWMDHWPPSPEISTKPNLHTPKQRLNSIKIPRNSKPQILHWNKTFPGSATGSSTSPQPSTHPQKCKTTPRTFVVERPTKPQILIQRTHNHHHQYSQPRLPALPHFQPPSFSAALRTQNDFNPDQNAPKRTQKITFPEGI